MRFAGRLLELQLGSLASCDFFEVGNLLEAVSYVGFSVSGFACTPFERKVLLDNRSSELPTDG